MVIDRFELFECCAPCQNSQKCVFAKQKKTHTCFVLQRFSIVFVQLAASVWLCLGHSKYNLYDLTRKICHCFCPWLSLLLEYVSILIAGAVCWHLNTTYERLTESSLNETWIDVWWFFLIHNFTGHRLTSHHGHMLPMWHNFFLWGACDSSDA